MEWNRSLKEYVVHQRVHLDFLRPIGTFNLRVLMVSRHIFAKIFGRLIVSLRQLRSEPTISVIQDLYRILRYRGERTT